MMCPVRLQLEKKCQDARATFEEAVKTLRKRIGTSRLEEYKTLHAHMGTAWHMLLGAQRDLEQHVEKHCCLSLGSRLPI